MRQIKFRGRNDHGWHFGLLTFMFDDYAISHVEDENTVDLITKSTVGQFTGLEDKNGIEIYEGDVIKVVEDSIMGGTYQGAIEYIPQFATYGFNMFDAKILEIRDFEKNSIGFNSKMLGNCFTLSEAFQYTVDSRFSIEIIGNVHDNPELIK